MKIRWFAVLTALLLLLPACASAKETPFVAREVGVSAVPSMQDPPPSDRKLPIGDESRTLLYQNDEPSISGETWEVFLAEDGTRAKFCMQNGSVAVTSDYLTPIAEAPKGLKTEADFLACIRDWVEKLAPDAKLTNYQYACTTTYFVRTEDDTTDGTTNSFHRAGQEGEEIDSYLFTYTQTAGGYSTGNGVTVLTDGKGNLLAFRYDCYETDWAFSITDGELNDTIDAYLKDYEKNSPNRVKSFSVLDKSLTIVDGRVNLSVTLELRLRPVNFWDRLWGDESTSVDTISLYIERK